MDDVDNDAGEDDEGGVGGGDDEDGEDEEGGEDSWLHCVSSFNTLSLCPEGAGH